MIEEYDCNPKDMICCMRPCIRKCHFEVSKDVADLFQKEFYDMKQIEEMITCTNPQAQKYTIDTCKINQNMMIGVGLLEENIIDSGMCTVCHSQSMHSYRTHKELAGRNTAILGMKQ